MLLHACPDGLVVDVGLQRRSEDPPLAELQRAPFEMRTPVLRASPHVDTTAEDLDQFAEALAAGIPVGGLTAGSSQRKTEVQARLWGGRPGVAFDPNYHTGRDTVDNIDRQALSVMGQALAFAVATYAQSVEGVNGVPLRDQRHRSTP